MRRAETHLPPIPTSSLRANVSLPITALVSTKPRFKERSCGIKNGNTLFITLVGIKRKQKSLLWLGHLTNIWDEWVGDDRLMKHTEENVMKQQAFDKKQGVDKSSKSGCSSQTKPKSSADAKVDKEDLKNTVAKRKKRKSDSGVQKDNSFVENLVKIQIPITLKKQLVDYWELVTQQDKLFKLPRSPNVDDILTKYLEYRSKKDVTMTDSIGEILKGICCYFDKALRVMLLYKKERQQYHEVVLDDVSPSTIYGAELLLRLFGLCKRIRASFFSQHMWI
ncbi:protein MRG1-like isoform X2 [Durio zibethinus]|uniref:Protein MRG1-like isoform X2 n=1 Tax=Durio zibethinus TaxID=66656 RepID=A0A6P5YJK3_DURZI|nr:protein MRG1-like isoform X2 [Durio zibethinus]XP_022740719.1 protein MRG1-like isoform X2 [Durio zibethinus]